MLVLFLFTRRFKSRPFYANSFSYRLVVLDPYYFILVLFLKETGRSSLLGKALALQPILNPGAASNIRCLRGSDCFRQRPNSHESFELEVRVGVRTIVCPYIATALSTMMHRLKFVTLHLKLVTYLHK